MRLKDVPDCFVTFKINDRPTIMIVSKYSTLGLKKNPIIKPNPESYKKPIPDTNGPHHFDLSLAT